MSTTTLEPTSSNQVAATTGTRAVDTRAEERYLRPPVDIYEQEDGLHVLVDLPGVEKDAVEVHVENGVLTIEGRTNWREPEDATYREFSLAGFYRQFRLNEKVDQEKISAELRRGVLHVQLPKAEQARPRRIDVRSV